MKAIIVSGGKGERLKPLTDQIPKPLIEVGGITILEHNINLFKKFGITDFIIPVCFLSEKITSYFGNGKKFGITVKYLYEDEEKPLGTAGSIFSSRKYLDSPFIVTYADILRDLNIALMLKFHENRFSFATLNVYKRLGLDPKSMVNFDQNQKIIEFIERPGRINSDSVWANGSFYIFEPGIFDYIPSDRFSDFGHDVFPELVKKKPVYAFPSEGIFIDIGNLDKLKKARELYSKINLS